MANIRLAFKTQGIHKITGMLTVDTQMVKGNLQRTVT